MIKYMFCLVPIFMLNSCVLPQNLNIDEDFKLMKVNKVSTHDSCSRFSYISSIDDKEFGKLFVEYINLDSYCKWNGLQRGFFVESFMTSVKAKSFKLIERVEKNDIEVSTYLIDEKYYVNIIDKYQMFENVLIIDYLGVYSTQLIKSFDAEYTNNYLNKPRFSSDYSKSLVNMNFVNSYFARENGNYED